MSTETHPPARPRAPPARWRHVMRERPLRALSERPLLAAALLTAVPVLLYLWPVLLGGRVLAPIPDLYLFLPWSPSAPSEYHDWFNIDLFDVPAAIYPWRFFAREAVRSGTFPAWNPHVFAGSPFFANPANGLFSIFSLPLWILPLNYGIGVGAALKLWAGGFGMWLLARELRLGMLPGLLAGVAFAFSSLNIVWLTHESLPAVAVVMPWMVWLLERVYARGRPVDVVWLAVATAIALGGGHAGMQVHVMVLVGLYALLRVLLLPAAPPAQRARSFGLALAGLVLGAGLMAIMLAPELLSSRDTLGTAARRGGRVNLPGSIMPFETIKTIAFPDWWGRGSGVEVRRLPGTVPGLVNFNERTFYAGVVTLLLACVGLLARGDWRRKAPFVALGTIGLAVPLHAPVLYWLATHLPVLADVQSQRLHFAYAFAAAMLAAFGLRALLDRPTEARWLAVPLGALLAGLVALLSAGARPGDAGRVLRHLATGVDYHRASVLALTSVVWFLLFAAGVGLALLAARRWPQRTTAAAVVLVALAVADALHFAHGYQPMPPASKAMPPRTPAIAFLQRHAGEGRFVGLEHIVSNDWSLLFGLDDVRGYDPPQPTLRFYNLWRVAEPNQPDWTTFEIDSAGPQALRAMSVLGVRYLVAYPDAFVSPNADTLAPLRRIYNRRDAAIFLNVNAPARALLAPRIRLTAGEGGTLAAIAERRFDPRAEVLVEQDEPGAEALAAAPPARGVVRIGEERNARVTLEATLDRRGLVVLNDNLTDGWRVTVDGRDAPVVRVNGVMRGVIVDGGRHEVVWSYAVPGLRLGAALSGLALALLAGAGLLLAGRRRRQAGAPLAAR